MSRYVRLYSSKEFSGNYSINVDIPEANGNGNIATLFNEGFSSFSLSSKLDT